MNGLTQIKDMDETLYDVQYDCDLEKFIVWEQDKVNTDGKYFTKQRMNQFLWNGDIEIVNDGNNIFKKYL